MLLYRALNAVVALFKSMAENKVISIADIRCSISCSWLFAIGLDHSYNIYHYSILYLFWSKIPCLWYIMIAIETKYM